MKSKLRLFSIFALVLAFPLTAAAQLEVSPSAHDFGDIEVGTTAGTMVTVMNLGGSPVELDAALSGSADFAIGPDVPASIDPGDVIDIPVTFTPSAAVYSTADLLINGTVRCSLGGMGVAVTPPPSGTVDDILAFFDASVADGTLYGDGPGSSANGRQKALRNKIKAAGNIIDDGADACKQLSDAYQRCDGLPRPPEFVAGPNAPTLAQMILDLMGSLGCE